MRAHRQTVAVLAAAVGFAALGGTSAPAQSDAHEALAQCRGRATEAERLACMEGLVLGLAAAAQPSPSASPEGGAAETVAPSMSAAPEAVPDSREGGGWRSLLPFGGDGDEEASPSPTTASSAADSFGAERLRTQEKAEAQREVLTARVVSFEEAPLQRLRVELDNGQVWEQREADPPWRVEQYGAPEVVEIFPSRFGGYRMRLEGKNLTLSVERVR